LIVREAASFDLIEVSRKYTIEYPKNLSLAAKEAGISKYFLAIKAKTENLEELDF
jgi:hypothetical protein